MRHTWDHRPQYAPARPGLESHSNLRTLKRRHLRVSPTMAFSVVLAVVMIVSADALFPLLVSGGQEIDIDTAATARVRMLSWLVAYVSTGICFAISWRSLFSAVQQNAVFVVLIALAFVSALWSSDPWRSAYAASQLGVMTVFALAVATRLTLERALLVGVLVHAGFIATSLAVIAIRPDLGISSSIMYSGAWRGIFIHKNHFGTQLSFAFATFFIAMLACRGSVRWFLSALLALTLALAALSRSSTALLTCMAIPAVYFAFRIAGGSRSMLYGFIGLSIAGLAAGAGSLAIGWETILDFLGKDGDLSGRTELWAMIFTSIESRPLLGFGYDAFWLSGARDGGAAITRSLVWSPGGAHNGWIEITTQLGIVGLALWTFVFFCTASRAFALGLSKHAGAEHPLMWLVLLCVPIVSWSLVESNIMRHGNSVHFMFALVTGYLSHQRARPTVSARGEAGSAPA